MEQGERVERKKKEKKRRTREHGRELVCSGAAFFRKIYPSSLSLSLPRAKLIGGGSIRLSVAQRRCESFLAGLPVHGNVPRRNSIPSLFARTHRPVSPLPSLSRVFSLATKSSRTSKHTRDRFPPSTD